jgi:hypothetical protein
VSHGLYYGSATKQPRTNMHKAHELRKIAKIPLTSTYSGHTYSFPHLADAHNGKINPWCVLVLHSHLQYGRPHEPLGTIRGSNLIPEDVISNITCCVAGVQQQSRLPSLPTPHHICLLYANFLKFIVYSVMVYLKTLSTAQRRMLGSLANYKLEWIGLVTGTMPALAWRELGKPRIT